MIEDKKLTEMYQNSRLKKSSSSYFSTVGTESNLNQDLTSPRKINFERQVKNWKRLDLSYLQEESKTLPKNLELKGSTHILSQKILRN